MDKTVTSIAHKPKKIPYNPAREAVREEQRLNELGVIETVPDEQPITWCTNVNPVIPSKPHNLEAIRFCSDMRVPNTAILLPVTEAVIVNDIKFKYEGATVFSVLDISEGCHQLELDEFIRRLTTFYETSTRLNYGTISAQDIFGKAMNDTIQGLNGVLYFRDDFERQRRVEALQQMDHPRHVSEVKSFLGMEKHSSLLIPNFSELTAPLCKLTHQGVQWKWSSTEQSAFDKLKEILSSSSVLGSRFGN